MTKINDRSRDIGGYVPMMTLSSAVARKSQRVKSKKLFMTDCLLLRK